MPPKRAKWSQQQLEECIKAVQGGIPVLRASAQFGIPRRTIRNHIKSGSSERSLGRKTILTDQQELELCRTIVRLGDVGMPVTSKLLRQSVYTFCEENCIKHDFNSNRAMAGRKWLTLFLQRHADVARRNPQALNPARAQKMNKLIVNDYFEKLKSVLQELQLIDKPQNIYNVDEKGCRLTLHHQQEVLVASENVENVTIVACGNALGQAIPPMVLFKGKQKKVEWMEGMPYQTEVHMTPKGSMTTLIFTEWFKHLAKFKAPGANSLVIFDGFDGASFHLDAKIVDVADQNGIRLLCLPSNTMHELQPLGKAVFKSFESFWDVEVIDYLKRYPERKITRQHFGEVFTPVWLKSMTPANLISGFKATGIYPFNPDVIPEITFRQSQLTDTPKYDVPHQTVEKPLADGSETNGDSNDATPGTATPGTSTGFGFQTILSTPRVKTQTRLTRKAVNSQAEKL